MKDAYNKYNPIEADSTASLEEKKRCMQEWNALVNETKIITIKILF
jgi:hypothetical protein